MPKCEDFYCWFGGDAVVKVIMYPRKMNTSHAGELYVCGARANRGLGAERSALPSAVRGNPAVG